MDNKQKKVGEAEILIGSFATLGVDTALILIKVLGVGLVLYAPIRAMGFTLSTWFFWSYGDSDAWKLERWLKRRTPGLIPFLPMLFIMFLVECYLHNKKIGGAATPARAGVKRPSLRKAP